MADVVSDLVLSFFCCCFYAPGDHLAAVGAHHYAGGSNRAHSATYRDAAHHHRSRPLPLQRVELRVRMCCDGCGRVVRQALQNLRGVESVEVNVPREKVTVRGYVDRATVLREVRRSGRKAELWPTGGWFFTSPRRSYHFRDAGSSHRCDGYVCRRHGRTRGGGGPAGSTYGYDDDDDGCRIM